MDYPAGSAVYQGPLELDLRRSSRGMYSMFELVVRSKKYCNNRTDDDSGHNDIKDGENEDKENYDDDDTPKKKGSENNLNTL